MKTVTCRNNQDIFDCAEEHFGKDAHVVLLPERDGHLYEHLGYVKARVNDPGFFVGRLIAIVDKVDKDKYAHLDKTEATKEADKVKRTLCRCTLCSKIALCWCTMLVRFGTSEETQQALICDECSKSNSAQVIVLDDEVDPKSLAYLF